MPVGLGTCLLLHTLSVSCSNWLCLCEWLHMCNHLSHNQSHRLCQSHNLMSNGDSAIRESKAFGDCDCELIAFLLRRGMGGQCPWGRGRLCH